MIARALLLPVAGLLVLASVRPLLAQAGDPAARFAGQTVTRVVLEVEGRDQAPPDLEALVAVRPGQPLRRDDWRTTLGRFAARFEQVTVLVAPEAGGVVVTFRLEPRHPIDQLEFSGDTGIAEGELRRLILARYGGLPDERLDEVESAVERLLLDQGHRDASVTAGTIETHNPDRATLVLDVAAGPVTRVATIAVAGESPYTPVTVISRAGLAIGDPWRPRETDTRVTAIEEALRSDRYYEASASVSAVRGDEGGMHVTVVVDAGPQIVLRAEGDALPEPIDELVPIEQSRSADVDLLEDARRRIEARLSDEGYRDARAPFTRLEQDDGSLLVITYAIDRGPRYRLEAVVVPDGLALAEATIRTALAIEAGAPFSLAQYEAGLQQVILAYQRLGYYLAAGRANYEIGPDTVDGERPVTAIPGIVEGPQGTVAAVDVRYTDTSLVPESALRGVMRLRPGEPYVLSYLMSDVADLEQVYRDRGFRSPLVTITPDPGDDGRSVQLLVTVSEGPQVIVGDILVVGHEQISEAAVRETLAFETGDPFGESAILESRRRLFELGIFRRVSITAQDALPGEAVTSIVVSVEELPATTIGFGGGLEVERRARSTTPEGETDLLALSPRGFFEIGRRNLGGRNRSVSLFSRVALKPRTVDEDDPDNTDTRRFGFTEYRVEGTFREQRAFRTDTNLLVSLASEQAVRTAFSFARQRLSAEALRRLSPRITLSSRYGLEFSRLFDVGIPEADRSAIDRLFPQVRLSTVSTGVLWDRRDDPVAPSGGTLVTADVEVALRSIGSEVGYTKQFFQLSAFHPLRPSRRVVAAGRVQLGLARGFERVVPLEDEAGNPVIGPDGEPLTERVADLPASQRFFAGGGTSVRGFQIDRLGVPEILNPNGLSNGGNAVMVVNGEVRTVVLQLFGRDLGAVGFVDTGNVFAKAGDLDLTRLRTTVGFGIRYDSPIGPLRLDFGFKTERLVVGGLRERGWEYHFSIGEAF